jgi:hypothetical protein
VLVPVAGIALVLGGLTAYAQQWLPPELGSLANSAGSWVLIAFLLALLANRPGLAAFSGALALFMMLAGYVIAADLRGYESSNALLVFWGTAAVLAGPFVGLAAQWTRSGGPGRVACGAGLIGGLLIGEAVYGLVVIADTTHPPYWWGELVAGVLVLGGVALSRRLEGRAVLAAVAVAAVVATAFFVVYRMDLIASL